MNNFHFGNNLRTVRTSKDFSQKQMGHLLRLSQSTYSRLERTKKIPDDEMVIKIADVLLVEKAKLLPSLWSMHPLKEAFNTPLWYLVVATFYTANGPAVWQITDAICEYAGVSEETTAIIRRLTIPLVPFIIWYCISRYKRGTKNRK